MYRRALSSSFVSRRNVLKSAVALGAFASLPAWFAEQVLAESVPTKPKSPNDMPGIGIVGCGGRGRFDGKEASKYGRIVACCDVDSSHAEGASVEFGGDAFVTTDFRKLMERKDVDVIVNGTPDHWHTLVNLHALKCGKDIYTEKPLTLTIDEGKHLRDAVKQSNRVVQVGSQQRSDPKFRLAAELVRNGRLGKMRKITVFVPAGLNGGPFKSAPVPKTLNWDMWLGQTRVVPFVPERCFQNFRFWYDYSGGTITDWGAHHNDIARWALGVDGPVHVEGRPTVEMTPGGYTAAAQYHVEYTYADGLKHICRTTNADSPFGKEIAQPVVGEMRNGIVFEGDNGWIWISRAGLDASDPALLNEQLHGNAERLYVSNDHMANFFECVRSRKAPIADAEAGHRSVTMCHLGSIATRLGRPLKWDPAKEEFVGDEEAQSWVSREQRKPWSYDVV